MGLKSALLPHNNSSNSSSSHLPCRWRHALASWVLPQPQAWHSSK